MHKNSIFWFRQDFRVYDNKGLIKAIENSKNLFPIFIFDTNIIPDFGGIEDKKFLFLKEALINLNRELEKLGGSLHIFHGDPSEIIPEICKKYDIDGLYLNTAYDRYGEKRDKNMKEYCEKKGIYFESCHDFLLVDIEAVPARKVFTPFYKIWQTHVPEIILESPSNFQAVKKDFDAESFLNDKIPGDTHPYFSLGFGKKRLRDFDFLHYDEYRNALDKDGTSRLSPYIRFGIFSIREVYKKVLPFSPHYISELAWREFWHHINFHFPFVKEMEFQEKRRVIRWKNDKDLFQKWCRGETGYPVVDAAMKQLVTTNWMHGRARMIVASFLTKDLLIDWRWGEEFFKSYLLDYDENVNFGNWQWSASVGADPKPLRIFSPLLQSQKFDPDAYFIKKYIPELQNTPTEHIHDPLKYSLDYHDTIVDHAEAQRLAREVYRGEG